MKKRGLVFYLKIYFSIIAQDIKAKMSYRADFIISLIGMLVTNVVGFISFWILFQNFPSISGWKYEEIVFLYSFSLIALVPQQCLFDNNWNLQQQVYSGDFIKYCFRPINVFFYFISEIFDIKGLGQLVIGISMLVYSWNKLSLEFSFIIMLKLIILLLTASLFMIAMTNISAATCFWLINTGVIMMMMSQLKDYARYPVTIFGKIFRFIFTFIIPIAFISYYPSLIFLNPDDVPILTWMSPIIGVIFFIGSYFFWIKGASEYSGTGS